MADGQGGRREQRERHAVLARTYSQSPTFRMQMHTKQCAQFLFLCKTAPGPLLSFSAPTKAPAMARPLSALLRHHKGDNTTLWAVLGLVALGALGVFALIFPLLQNLGGIGLAKGQWNVEISLTIDTPHGPVSGSVVRTYYAHEQPAIAGGGHSIQLAGEALAIEIMPGKWLFGLADTVEQPASYDSAGNYEGANSEAAIIRWYKNRPDGYGREITINPKIFYEDRKKSTTLREQNEIDRRNRILRETTPRDTYPGTLVTFTDITDPSTIQPVDLANLEKTFGPGFSFREGYFNFTKKDATINNIKKILPWVYAENDTKLAPGSKIENLPSHITRFNIINRRIFDTTQERKTP